MQPYCTTVQPELQIFCAFLATRQAECCTLSQAPTTQQAVQKFYDLFSPNSLCIEHVDHTQVPTNKNVLLRMYIYKMQQHAYAPECDRLLNLVSSSRTRRELLRVRAKKDYHLEGLQAQTLAPNSPDNNSEVLSSGAMYLLLYI